MRIIPFKKDGTQETPEEKEDREKAAKLAADEESQRVKAFCDELKQEDRYTDSVFIEKV